MGKPLLFGYQAIRVGTPVADLDAGRESLRAFAEREGLQLATVFVDADANHPCRGLIKLIQAARRSGTCTVAVPTRRDLGSSPAVQSITIAMIRRESGATVRVVEETSVCAEVVRP